MKLLGVGLDGTVTALTVPACHAVTQEAVGAHAASKSRAKTEQVAAQACVGWRAAGYPSRMSAATVYACDGMMDLGRDDECHCTTTYLHYVLYAACGDE